ncbi:MAG: GEVED domain-containing protein [Thermoanaerobaculia bacterium]|nr:GEVED domain-containing protein [Thermoanaerobaculia bacterium]
MNNVDVRVFDASGASGVVTTNAVGSCDFTAGGLGLAGTSFRVEIDVSSLPPAYGPGAVGIFNLGSDSPFVQFVDDGQTVGFVAEPFVGCADPNPSLATSCYQFGGPASSFGDGVAPWNDGGAVVRIQRNDSPSNVNTANEYLVDLRSVGSLGGNDFHSGSNVIFAGAIARVGSEWGPEGSGGIYVIDNSVAEAGVLASVSIPGAGSTPRGVDPFGASFVDCSSPGVGISWFHDACAFGTPGKEGLGDLELDDSQNNLFTIRLADQTLWLIDVSTPTAPVVPGAAQGTITNPGCPAGDWRPWGLEWSGGALYVGGVCSGQSNGSTPVAHVLRFDDPFSSAAATSIFSHTLGFARGHTGNFGYIPTPPPADWRSWTDDWEDLFFSTNGAGTISYPYGSQPMLSDMTFLPDGSMVLAFRDRFGDQLIHEGFFPYIDGDDPDSNNNTPGIPTTRTVEPYSGGDLNLVCWDPHPGGAHHLTPAISGLANTSPRGDWVWEGGTLSDTTTCPINVGSSGEPEFFDHDTIGLGENGAHQETNQGHLAFLPGTGETASIVMDPQDFLSGGIAFFENSTGESNGDGYEIFQGGMPFSFKSNGLGDLGYLCPLQTLEVGDLVWYDIDADGIQDPGESPVQNVTVRLFDASGTQVGAPTTTDSAGHYYFSGAAPDRVYFLEFDISTRTNLLDVALGLTVADAGMSATADLRDSDGVTPASAGPGSLGTLPRIGFRTQAGVNKHDLDLGLIPGDLGDAPSSYGTAGVGAAEHTILPGFHLGSTVDSEGDGQPSAGADGDDTTGTPDDEDGIAFAGGMAMAAACSTGNGLTVTLTSTNPAVSTAFLDAWIDWNGDGDFDHSAEHLFGGTSASLSTGANALSYDVPCDARLQGVSYARFRLSSVGSLLPTGTANDGEVEDYLFAVKSSDFGDAPDTYGTESPATAASHVVDPGAPLFLGSCVDTEATGGQPSIGADGDDNNADGTASGVVGTCSGVDDEDGVTFTQMIVACQTVDITVAANAVGHLSAWIDYNGNGTFDGAELAINQAVAAGSQQVSVSVPCSAESQSQTYARFRLAPSAVAGPTGATNGGEVEDYEVTVKGLDLGDAPDSYGTQNPATAASHVVDPVTPFYLGSCVDTEAMGQPVIAGNPADGDDLGSGLSTVGTCTGNDDEDGVSFDTMIVACDTADLSVTASAAGLLDAWIDFAGDGTFGAGDQIFNSQALAAGVNSLSFSTPCSAVSDSAIYARFRLTTTGGVGPTGFAMDGEVEDYSVTTKGQDLGDAPDSYGTQDPATAARHMVDPSSPLFLGACVDTEVAGQPVVSGTPADGDDSGVGDVGLGTCTGNDDEDGVSFDSMVVACGSTDLTVVASQSGFLDAWVDFAGDGAFDAGDQILTSQAVTAGSQSLSFNVPCSVVSQSTTYARFRISSVGGLGAIGTAMDGEVEDYEVATKGVDLGDAPDTYGTQNSATAASHAVDPNVPLFLGSCVDTEVAGQPVVSGTPADGDDLGAGLAVLGTCTGNDDEDGVVFDDMVIACGTTGVTVTASQSGVLNAWLDFAGDGVFDVTDQIFTDQAISAGANALSFNAPCDVGTQTITYARFRVATVGGLGATGSAMNGEIEDHDVPTKGLDLGDAPEAEGYPTLIASDGARHVVQPSGNPTLGPTVDTEADGQPSPAHDGDDIVGDDEDGVTISGNFVPGGDAETLTLTTGTTGGLVSAWIDWNGDGDWNDAGEQVATDLAIAASSSFDLDVTAPASATLGATCLRVRISTAGGDGPTGLAMDGEIEDYGVEIGMSDPEIGMAKEVIAVDDLGGGEFSVIFAMNVENLGDVPLSNIQILADLATAFADAEGGWDVGVLDSTYFAVNPAFDGDTVIELLLGTDSLAVGSIGFLTLEVIVRPGSQLGPYFCSGIVTAEDPGGEVVEDESQDGDDSDPDGDDDPGNNDVPTVVIFPAPPFEVPTLGAFGQVALLLLLMTAAIQVLHRR